MSLVPDFHASTAAAPLPPTPDAHADADLSDADWGSINREALAERLAAVYWRGPVSLHAMAPESRADWLAVADAAVAEVLGVEA